MPLGVLGFVFTVITLAAGLGLLLTVVGVVVLAISTEGVRFRSGGARIQSNILLGTDVATPSPVPTHSQGRGHLRALTYGGWWPLLPCNTGGGGVCHHAAALGPDYFLDTPLRVVATTVVGVLLLLAAPWVLRAVLSVDTLLVEALLGPTAGAALPAVLSATARR